MVSVRSGNTSSNIVQATNSMAKHYAELAEGYKDDAATYAQASLLQAALAQQWAIKMDGAVDGEEYSSKYYANIATSAITTLEPILDDLTNLDTLAANISDISAVAADLTNINNASSYAQLAEDWATKTNGTVDGTDYSAKYYAQSISSALSNYTPTANLADVALSGDYDDLTGTPTIPTKTSELTNDSGFTTNTGTITGITMNGASKGTSGVVDLGTVITSHQDISGKQDKSNLVTSVSSSSTHSQYPSAKLFYDTVGNIESTINTIRGI